MSGGLPLSRLAIVDGGSFVLPYDHGLVQGLVRRGHAVTFFGSRTRYNAEFLAALRAIPGVEVVERDVSGSVAAPWRGALAYVGLLAALWRRRHEFLAVNLQFSALWPLELPLLWLLRRRLVLTLHNAVPHGHPGLRHRPTQWLAALAQRLVFVSTATHDDFTRRYGEAFEHKCVVLPHGLLPLAPGLPPVAYAPLPQPEALVFWSSVRPYKGVDLFLELARSPRWRERGLPLEVHGAWAHELHGLRDELRGLGVKVVDAYLDTPALQALLARPVVFALPYLRASQSGALYTLLHHGRVFICTDVGDLGAFMHRAGLQALLLPERNVEAVQAALRALRVDAAKLARALAAAQQQRQWDQVLVHAEQAYGPAAAASR